MKQKSENRREYMELWCTYNGFPSSSSSPSPSSPSVYKNQIDGGGDFNPSEITTDHHSQHHTPPHLLHPKDLLISLRLMERELELDDILLYRFLCQDVISRRRKEQEEREKKKGFLETLFSWATWSAGNNQEKVQLEKELYSLVHDYPLQEQHQGTAPSTDPASEEVINNSRVKLVKITIRVGSASFALREERGSRNNSSKGSKLVKFTLVDLEVVSCIGGVNNGRSNTTSSSSPQPQLPLHQFSISLGNFFGMDYLSSSPPQAFIAAIASSHYHHISSKKKNLSSGSGWRSSRFLGDGAREWFSKEEGREILLAVKVDVNPEVAAATTPPKETTKSTTATSKASATIIEEVDTEAPIIVASTAIDYKVDVFMDGLQVIPHPRVIRRLISFFSTTNFKIDANDTPNTKQHKKKHSIMPGKFDKIQRYTNYLS